MYTPKKVFLNLLLGMFLIFSVTSVYAAATTTTSTIPLDLARQVSNLYNWAIGAGAIVALGIIIYGGVLYSASAGNASRIGEAKTWIQSAIFGLILLFSSYLILFTINPNLVKLEDIFLKKNVPINPSGIELTGRGGSCEGNIQPVKNTPNYGGARCIRGGSGGEVFYTKETTVAYRKALVGNFGDPDCNSSTLGITGFIEEIRSAVRKELEDNTNYCQVNIDRLTRIMTDMVIPGESGYSPNAFAECSASERGAFGLFQMNPVDLDNPNRISPGEPDWGGDVPWREQVKNAISKLKEDKGETYWAQWPGRKEGKPWDKLITCESRPGGASAVPTTKQVPSTVLIIES